MSNKSKALHQPQIPKTAHGMRILNALRTIIQAIDIDSRRMSIRNHITGPQLICLEQIAASGSATITQISERIHVSSSTIVGVIDRLEEKGLAVRNRARVDRRKVFITATAAGRRLAHKAPSPLLFKLRENLEDLEPKDREKLAAAIERLAFLLSPAVE